MKKIDMHLHLTLRQIPKIGKMNLTSGKNMLPHLEELGIGKGVLMSSGEKKVPFGNNKGNKAICDKFKFASLGFQSLEGVINAIGIEPCKLCTYCWNGKE